MLCAGRQGTGVPRVEAEQNILPKEQPLRCDSIVFLCVEVVRILPFMGGPRNSSVKRA